MQISRSILLACVAAIFLNPFLLRASDTEAQIRSRQALEEKMRQLDMQAATSAPPAAVTKPAKPAKTTKTKSPAKPVVPVVEVTKPEAPVKNPVPPAVLVKPGEPPHVQPVTPTTVPVAPAPTVSAPPRVEPVPVVSNPEMDAKTREAVRQKMIEMQATASIPSGYTNETSQPWGKPYVSTNVVSMTSPPPAAKTSGQPSYNLPALTAPPSSLSASKEQRLQQLLQLYRADQITPQEYHAQRSKILAEP